MGGASTGVYNFQMRNLCCVDRITSRVICSQSCVWLHFTLLVTKSTEFLMNQVQKQIHTLRKERVDTSQLRILPYNSEEIQIQLAGKTAWPTAPASTFVLPITAFSQYKTPSMNAKCLTFKADCRIPFFLGRVPLHASCNLGTNCTETVLAGPGRRWTQHAPIKSSAYTQLQTSLRWSVLTHFWSAAHFSLYRYCLLETEERILQTENSTNSSNFLNLTTCNVWE